MSIRSIVKRYLPHAEGGELRSSPQPDDSVLIRLPDGDARDAFRREVNVSLALGPDVELPVTDSDGGHPVLVALEADPVSVVLDRIRAAGGAANLFVRGVDEVCEIRLRAAGANRAESGEL